MFTCRAVILSTIKSLRTCSISELQMPFYAVRRGKCPGIYHTWAECKTQVDQYAGARYKKFDSEQEAKNFINGFDVPGDTPGKSKPGKTTSHSAKPYQKSPAPASSSNWKQNRVTKMIDLDEARQLHTSTRQGCDSDSSSPVVYTDGACTCNGTPQAKAGIGVYWGPGHPYNVSERLPGRQTNNRAEIFAVVKAVEQAKLQGFSELTVKTDSNFLINSITKWVPGWQRKGWKTAAGKPVINKEDFESLLDMAQGVKINWVHVAAHQGIEGNEAADRLAVEGANKPDAECFI